MSEAAHSLQILELNGLWYVFWEKRWDGSKIPRKSVVVHLFFFSATGHWNAKWIGTDHGEIVEGNCDGYFDHSRDYVPSPHIVPTLFDTVCKVSMCKPELPQKES